MPKMGLSSSWFAQKNAWVIFNTTVSAGTACFVSCGDYIGTFCGNGLHAPLWVLKHLQSRNDFKPTFGRTWRVLRQQAPNLSWETNRFHPSCSTFYYRDSVVQGLICIHTHPPNIPIYIPFVSDHPKHMEHIWWIVLLYLADRFYLTVKQTIQNYKYTATHTHVSVLDHLRLAKWHTSASKRTGLTSWYVLWYLELVFVHVYREWKGKQNLFSNDLPWINKGEQGRFSSTTVQ